MSDTPSFYMRVKLSPQAYADYLESDDCSVPSDFDDWVEWLNTKGNYDPPITQADVDEYSEVRCGERTVKESLEGWCSSSECYGLTMSTYDSATGIWQFSSLDFSYSIYTLLASLPLLRSVCRYKDTADTDYLLIYDFLNFPTDRFGIFTLEQGRSSIVESVPEAFVAEANAHLSKQYDLCIRASPD
ncbi:hypothetical protein [Herbaspirillum rubrisubalbicans]|uniref:Uncharacterized protein n=1 Tax=Herbaspirillum rubrisubalbicans TaxID=80842 RepID=A0ABX9C5P4_9BURK|nr:hypothetical protein [Herbaspirillum rubrisubalbicans]RAM65926.1 hypothetical protein RB24_05380 [Herbaspirillum rubrisubalbicans]